MAWYWWVALTLLVLGYCIAGYFAAAISVGMHRKGASWDEPYDKSGAMLGAILYFFLWPIMLVLMLVSAAVMTVADLFRSRA